MLDLELVTPPTAELVTLAQLRAHLRLDDIEDHDGALAEYLSEAVGALDGYAGTLGRALAQQTWRLYLPRFPAGCVQLPLPPLISVGGITYVDTTGATQTLAADRYTVLAGEKAQIHRAYGQTWPSVRCVPRAVAVTFTCGWAAPAADAAWPLKLQPVRSALKLMVEERFAGPDTQRQMAIERLLRPLRIPRV